MDEPGVKAEKKCEGASLRRPAAQPFALEGSVFMLMLVPQDWNCFLNGTGCQIKDQSVIKWLKKLLPVGDVVEIWLP